LRLAVIFIGLIDSGHGITNESNLGKGITLKLSITAKKPVLVF